MLYTRPHHAHSVKKLRTWCERRAIRAQVSVLIVPNKLPLSSKIIHPSLTKWIKRKKYPTNMAKKLNRATDSMIVAITPLANCSFCLEANKPCIAPYIPAQNQYNQGQYLIAYICSDCCKEAVKLLRPYQPLPDQV